VNGWTFPAWLLAGFIAGVAVTSAAMWFGRHRIRAWLSRRRGP
jgi:hypothetical protein